MDKILQTQLTHILNGINKQEEEIEMASRLLAQAIIGEGNIYVRGLGDFELLEAWAAESETALPRMKTFEGIAPITTADRVLVVSKFVDEPLTTFLQELEEVGIEYVLVCNSRNPVAEVEFDFESVHHFIDLSSPREVIPTPDLERIVNPYVMAFMYIYYQMYALVMEMSES